MKRLFFHGIVFFVVHILYAGGTKSDSGDDVCWHAFDISNRTIIKSTESLNSGARYLKSIRLKTRDECMTACCNIEGCNLAVLQEKTNGDCYLFDCGPLSDFKCTFGVHDDHVAMGMMINRDDIKKTQVHEQAKHEMDLNLLKAQQDILDQQQQKQQRNQDTAAAPEPEIVTPAASQQNYFPSEKDNIRKNKQQVQSSLLQDDLASTNNDDSNSKSSSNEQTSLVKPKAILDKKIAKPVRPFNDQMQRSMKSKSSCGPQQWQCETSDQCIADYDKCDSIPQCPDGSDEKNCDSILSQSNTGRRPNNVPVQNPPPMYGRYYPADSPPQQANDLSNGDQSNKNQNRQSYNDFQNYDSNNPNYQLNQQQQQQQQQQQGKQQFRQQQQNSLNLNPNWSKNQQQMPGKQNDSPNQQNFNDKPNFNNQRGQQQQQQQTMVQKPALGSTMLIGDSSLLHQRQSAETQMQQLDYGRGSTSLAAVMLGLGLAVLALLLMFISCRLRRARRRLRRGKVLDADEGEYLINGMYL